MIVGVIYIFFGYFKEKAEEVCHSPTLPYVRNLTYDSLQKGYVSSGSGAYVVSVCDISPAPMFCFFLSFTTDARAYRSLTR